MVVAVVTFSPSLRPVESIATTVWVRLCASIPSSNVHGGVLRSGRWQHRMVGAMSSAEDATGFEAVGLFDPSDAIVGRLELLRWLVEQGFTVDEMLDALAAGRLSGLPGDRRLFAGPLLRRDEAIAASSLEVHELEDGVRAFGFSGLERSPDGEIGVTAEEASAIATFTAFGRMFTSEEAHAFFRVIGSSVARIADAAVSLFLADVESRSIAAGESELELARKVHDAVALLDGFTVALDPILRRHVMQAIERSRKTTISVTERLEYRYAIGFVDLVGFTQIAGAMAPHELAGFLRDFEARAHDAATAVGARVVKMIGDEVMFVSSDASSAVAAGDALMEGLGSAYEHIVPRGALAYGDMLVRGGDYFGSVVNLASRLVDEAVPHELLVTEQLASAAPDCEFEPAGRRMVKGFADPVVVLSLVH